ncbi:MAG: cytochrome C biogenesis protein [Thaumarchaeota archaeon]|nr:cytochrome C biogenesis protein [Nitrososphaerota archaeon]MDD9812896.1 cytochrome C biogenesis protein [Nitrososphaerota archaeon]MDD9825700.1 cytochrome C biogenesis protein [Nitrososphaerota archaeon]MDD9843572.1 cytochrome C biogenesis protein [Nitrososphaerota archaeon]
MAEVSIAIAALAGVGSFVAPCILPMIPAFLAYISGTTVAELAASSASGAPSRGARGALAVNRVKVMLNTAFFVLGFSVVFSTLGVLINSVLYDYTADVTGALNQVGGVIIIGFGAYMLLSTRVASLNLEKKFLPRGGRASLPMSFVFGLAFAAGWTPCVGPVLGTILTLAATTPSASFSLLLAYSLGLGVPFLLMGAFFSRATPIVRAMSRHLRYYSVALGAMIVVLGVLVLTGQLAYIANFPLLNELVLLG